MTPAQSELTERMSDSVSALDTMFNALLDISRMDAGAIVAEVCCLDLEAMLHRVAGDFSNEAAAKRLRFSVRVSKAARDLRARSDPVLLERIVRNLLANAIRYTQSGGVVLTCRLRGGNWRIEVWYTGPGIRPDHHELIFDEFFQIDDPEREQAGGLGLGLSIVRRLSQLLGHPLTLRSAVGHGSCFALTVPATTEPARSPSPSSRSAAARAGSRRHRRRSGGSLIHGRPARTLGLQGACRRNCRRPDPACRRKPARACAGARRRSPAAPRAQRHRRDRCGDARSGRPLPDADRFGGCCTGASGAASEQRLRVADEARGGSAFAKLAHPGRRRRVHR